MDQRDKQELISAYWDGELTGAERTEAESLLESLPELRRDLDDYARLSDLIRGLPNESAPVELAAGVRRQAEAQSLLSPAAALPKRSLRREWLSALAGMAVTAAAVLVMVQTREYSASRNAEVSSGHVAAGVRTMASAEATTEPQNSAFSAVSSALPESAAAPAHVPSGAAGGESELPAASPELAATAVAPSPAMLGLSLNEFSEQEGLLNGVRIGSVLQYLEQRGDSVAVVELQVVDVSQSLGQLEVLLKEQQVDVLPVDVAKNPTPLPEQSEKAAAESSADEGQLTTVFLEASANQVDQLFSEMSRRNVFVQASLQPPVDVPVNAGLELSDVKSAEEPALAKRDSELVRVEADVATRQYAQRGRASQIIRGSPESNSAKEDSTANRTSSKQSRLSGDRLRPLKAAPTKDSSSSREQSEFGSDGSIPQLKQNVASIQQQPLPKQTSDTPVQDVSDDAEAPEPTVRLLMVLKPQQQPVAAPQP
ncbi:MAG: hypothetical protein U0872_09255 [Planctomycetaceae bacterium]